MIFNLKISMENDLFFKDGKQDVAELSNLLRKTAEYLEWKALPGLPYTILDSNGNTVGKASCVESRKGRIKKPEVDVKDLIRVAIRTDLIVNQDYGSGVGKLEWYGTMARSLSGKTLDVIETSFCGTPNQLYRVSSGWWVNKEMIDIKKSIAAHNRRKAKNA